MQQLLRAYLRRLTHLGGDNRALGLWRLSAEQDLDLHALDYLYQKPSFHLIEQLIAGKKQIALTDLTDPRNELVNQLSKQIRRIHRKEKLITSERGSKDLYVGWPIVKGQFQGQNPVQGPLLLFPVTLKEENNRWWMETRNEVPLSFNKSLLMAYAHYHSVNLPDDFIDLSFEDWDKDSLIFRTRLYEVLKQSPLQVHFNQDLFADKLISFVSGNRETVLEQTEEGVLRLFPQAVLGIFPSLGSALAPDYEQLIGQSTYTQLEDFFLSRTSALSGNTKEAHTFTPFPIDASQEQVLKKVKQGASLVVQGPPGSGKSQLIANLVSDFMARGKKYWWYVRSG